MIEKTILDYLNASMSVKAYMEHPEGESEYVLIQKVGGNKTDRIWSSVMQFTVVGSSMYRAAFLCDELVQKMDAAPDTLDSISGTHYGGSYNATFPTDKTYRYRATYEIYHY